jgi:hypothetical protein
MILLNNVIMSIIVPEYYLKKLPNVKCQQRLDFSKRTARVFQKYSHSQFPAYHLTYIDRDHVALKFRWKVIVEIQSEDLFAKVQMFTI